MILLTCIHDLAHVPTHNCLADFLTKASAKADNLITAVRTDFRTLTEHKTSFSTWCRTSMNTREKDIFPDCFEDFSHTNFTRRTFHVMFVRNQHIDERKELNTCERESQDTTKISSALADSRTIYSWSVVSLLVRTLCLCMALMTIFLSVISFSQLCDHVIVRTHWCWQSEQMDTESS